MSWKGLCDGINSGRLKCQASLMHMADQSVRGTGIKNAMPTCKFRRQGQNGLSQFSGGTTPLK